MKKSATLFTLLAGGILLVAGPVVAATYAYVPDPADLNDLDHYYNYTWGIDVSELSGMLITEVELTIDNITNWDDNTNVLYIHLLNDAALGVTSAYDNQGGGDAFSGQGELVEEFVDGNGSGTTENLTCTLSTAGLLSAASAYLADGVLAFAFDPDCHYWNDGVTLVITAEPPSATEKATWGDVKNLFR